MAMRPRDRDRQELLCPHFERHVIDDDSGIGRQITARDIDADGDLDLVEATTKGLFLFRRDDE
jgi:hypothetical protein